MVPRYHWKEVVRDICHTAANVANFSSGTERAVFVWCIICLHKASSVCQSPYPDMILLPCKRQMHVMNRPLSGALTLICHHVPYSNQKELLKQ